MVIKLLLVWACLNVNLVNTMIPLDEVFMNGAPKQTTQETPAEEIVIRLKPGSSKDDMDSILNRYPEYVFSKEFVIGANTYYELKLDKSKAPQQYSVEGIKDGDESVKKLKHEKNIDFVEVQVKHTYQIFAKNTDPELSGLWHLNNDVTYSQNIDKAWALGYTGKGITVGVVDTLIDTNHTDLPIDADNSYDYYNDRKEHIYKDLTHGTSVSGFIAALRGNNKCSVGVAYDAKIVAIGLLGANSVSLTDSQIAKSLSHYWQNVDIYCNSWGGRHTGDFRSLGTLTKEAIESTIRNGRGGKGSIYVFANGNAGPYANSNADEMLSSIYTMSINSVQDKSTLYYGEIGSNIIAVCYGGSLFDWMLTSTSPTDSCTRDLLQGTSFAAPIAVGIIALALQANPALTWRDIQHLTARTSKRHGFTDNFTPGYEWKQNGRGLWVHPKMGFGLMDAEGMVKMAKIWRTVGPQQTYSTGTIPGYLVNGENVKFTDLFNSFDALECFSSTTGSKLWHNTENTLGNHIRLIVSKHHLTSANAIFREQAVWVPRRGNAIRFLEHVLINIDLVCSVVRRFVEIDLVSPSGTVSQILTIRPADVNGNTMQWTFKSVHFWGENPIGNWKIKVRSTNRLDYITVHHWSLQLYGTSTNPRWWKG